MSTKMKLASLISAFILVVGLVVIGVLAASSKTISMNGSVSFNVLDKSLWVKEVRMQETGSEAVEIADFTPGYINGDFNFTVGDFENNRGSFAIYFDIINTTLLYYNVSVTIPESYETNNIEVSIVDSIPAGITSTITEDTQATTTLELTVINPNLIDIDLSDIVINIEEVPPTPASSFTFSFNDTDHTATITGFTGSEEEILIPSTIDKINDTVGTEGSNYTVIAIGRGLTGNGAFQNSKIIEVILPNSIQIIQDTAFWGCQNLISVVIPSSVTSIGTRAFYDCGSLTSITIPDSVTSIGDSVFMYCDSLTSITIPDSVTSISSSAFYNCSSLTSITIPESVTSIGPSAFADCSNLISVSFENQTGWFTTSSSTATSGTSIDVSNPAQNAEWITSTYGYYNRYWKRS